MIDSLLCPGCNYVMLSAGTDRGSQVADCPCPRCGGTMYDAELRRWIAKLPPAYYYLPSGVLVQHWFHTRQAAEKWLASKRG